MQMLKNIMHDKLIKGETIPIFKAIHDNFLEQKRYSDCGEVQGNYNLLETLLQHTLDSPDAKTNSFGLIDLF